MIYDTKKNLIFLIAYRVKTTNSLKKIQELYSTEESIFYSLFFNKIKKNYSNLDLRYRKMFKYLFHFTETTHRIKATNSYKKKKKLYSTGRLTLHTSTLRFSTIRKTTPILLYDTRRYTEYIFNFTFSSQSGINRTKICGPHAKD